MRALRCGTDPSEYKGRQKSCHHDGSRKDADKNEVCPVVTCVLLAGSLIAAGMPNIIEGTAFSGGAPPAGAGLIPVLLPVRLFLLPVPVFVIQLQALIILQAPVLVPQNVIRLFTRTVFCLA